MVDINSAFPSNYLKAADLQGRECKVVISHVTSEDIGSGEHKLVVYFTGKDRGLVLNKTNASTIASVTGQNDTDMWVNAPIILFPTQTDFQGKQVACIRVKLLYTPSARPAPPPQNSPPNTALGQNLDNPAMGGDPVGDDEIPF